MESINDRFKQLRKACHKTQEELGHILGITRPGVTDIESSRRKVTEKHLIMLSNWHEYKVNIDWLRTGEGGPDAMFLPPEDDDLVAQAKTILGEKDPLFESLVITYSKLSKSNRETLLNFFTDFTNTLLEKKDGEKVQSTSSNTAVAEEEAHGLKLVDNETSSTPAEPPKKQKKMPEISEADLAAIENAAKLLRGETHHKEQERWNTI